MGPMDVSNALSCLEQTRNRLLSDDIHTTMHTYAAVHPI
jgi:hypothetical protein